MEGTEATTTRCGTCRKCGVSVCSQGRRGRTPSICASCKRQDAKERPRLRVVNSCRKCESEFEASSKETKFCPSCRPTAEMMTCVVCGTVRKKSAAGGNSAGLCCSTTCAGVLRTRKATKRRADNPDRLLPLLEFVRRLVEKERTDRLRALKSLLVLCARLLANEKRCCLHCGRPLSDPHGMDRLCSSECKALRQRLQIRKNRKRKPGTRKHQKRAALRGLPRSYSKAMMIQSVGDRDEWICQLCRDPIDDSNSREGPRAPCIDHIVPLNHKANTRHGHTPENVQIAHRSCNEAKGCSVACVSLVECDNPREWLKIARIAQYPPGGGLAGGLLGRTAPWPLGAYF
jgi:hypothetical protein